MQSEMFPETLMLRDPGIYTDSDGLEQRIYSTAGTGCMKVKYIRADSIAGIWAELVDAAGNIPIEYDAHGEPASQEWRNFVSALTIAEDGG